MKLAIPFFLLALSLPSFASQPSILNTQHSANLSVPVGSTAFTLPETGGRKGSKRMGGYGKHGKGSHYVGGRK